MRGGFMVGPLILLQHSWVQIWTVPIPRYRKLTDDWWQVYKNKYKKSSKNRTIINTFVV